MINMTGFLAAWAMVATIGAVTLGIQGDTRAVGFTMLAVTLWIITLVNWRDDRRFDRWLKERMEKEDKR